MLIDTRTSHSHISISHQERFFYKTSSTGCFHNENILVPLTKNQPGILLETQKKGIFSVIF